MSLSFVPLQVIYIIHLTGTVKSTYIPLLLAVAGLERVVDRLENGHFQVGSEVTRNLFQFVAYQQGEGVLGCRVPATENDNLLFNLFNF